MDIAIKKFNETQYKEYIHGSAEVVGLMCLKVFVNGNKQKYEKLKHSAISLGAAFQKVNFLRDLHYDTNVLNRKYYNIEADKKSIDLKKGKIILNIKEDFKNALHGIKKLDKGAQIGVYTSYLIYQELLKKIEKANSIELITKRMSVLKTKKLYLFLKSFLIVSTNLNRAHL